MSTISVSEFIKVFYPFDSDEVSKGSAKRSGKTQAEVYQEWKQKRLDGSRYHDKLDKLISAKFNRPESYSRLIDELADDEKFISKQITELFTGDFKGWMLVETEHAIEAHGLRSRIDAVFADKDANIMICEWKFGSKLWERGFDGNKALGPFSNVDNCKYNQASTQAAFYGKLYEQKMGIVPIALRIVHMSEQYGLSVKPVHNGIFSTVNEIWSCADNTADYVNKFIADAFEKDVLTPGKQKEETTSTNKEDSSTKEGNDGIENKTATFKWSIKEVNCRDVMIDLETLSTEADAHILTIGAIKFNRKGKLPKMEEMDTFYRRITFSSNERLDLHKSESTVKWWGRQNKKARKEAFEESNRVELEDALKDFNEWFRGAKYIWSHGCGFDVTIITEAFQHCDMKPPFKFWDVRDTRTIYDIASVSMKDHTDKEAAHHALHDCYFQISGMKEAFVCLNPK